MGFEEDFKKFNFIILVVPKRDITKKLLEANKLAKTHPRTAVMLLHRDHLDDMDFCKYCHLVISQVRLSGSKGIFMCAREDLNEELKDDLKMFVDLVKEV